MRRPLSSYHPWLYSARIWQRQKMRHLRWFLGPEKFAMTQATTIPHVLYRHQSRLRRYLSDDPQDVVWQDNKVHNHSLALPYINGVVIAPGETFSFWRLVGRPSAKRGFREGMELSRGRARGGIGGGLCQLGNMLHWMALHSPLEVRARASHSFDPFPDQNRVLPYGTGAALCYNFVDLWLYNPSPDPIQIRMWMTDTALKGELRGPSPLPHRYHVYERAHGFEQHGQDWLRHNQIWRQIKTKGPTPTVIEDKLLYSNRVRVMYTPAHKTG